MNCIVLLVIQKILDPITQSTVAPKRHIFTYAVVY